MSVDTKLMVSQKYNLREICEVLENHLHITDIEVKSNVNIAPGYFNVLFKINGNSRMMHVHLDSESPIGPCVQMSLNSDSQGINVMYGIANVIGGLVCEEDSGDKWDMVHGKLWDEDGLPYFLKWATINNKMPKGTIRELNEAIKEWQSKVSSCKQYDLY